MHWTRPLVADTALAAKRAAAEERVRMARELHDAMLIAPPAVPADPMTR